MLELKDCAWCGMPMEAVSTWLLVRRERPDGMEFETEMVSARCLGGHWYGGPVNTVLPEGEMA